MSIDYDRLRELLVQYHRGGNVNKRLEAKWELEYRSFDIAFELIRLRDEIKRTRDRITDELERIPAELQAARITLHTEREHFLTFCTYLLEGDTP